MRYQNRKLREYDQPKAMKVNQLQYNSRYKDQDILKFNYNRDLNQYIHQINTTRLLIKKLKQFDFVKL